ncbi:MAG: CoA transferase [Burkholderiales bacterium]|nr:CoA transferase [Burkholderiales bacterium]ODU66683.1 MAG: acetyl-CoA acetyltransferase [Lautropia sp. SCN 66-9]
MSGPLAGVRVVDLSTVLMGPYATQILADFGADVVKIEPIEGDVMRYTWPFRHAGMGHIFLHTNRNKRSAALDLKRSESRDAVLALARDADVLVYNIRPQAMARLGLSYETLSALNPRLIYVGAFGYSQRGPNAARPAYDDLIQGAIGLPWLSQQHGGEPQYSPTNLVDRAVGQQIASAVSAALYSREKTGRGQRIDIPMFEHMLAMVMGEHLAGATFEPRVGDTGYPRLLARDRRPFATRDGYICVLIYNDKQWRAFFSVIGKPQMMEEDERFASQQARSRHYDYAYALVADELRQRSTDEWMAAFEQADIPAQRMNSLEDIIADEHLQAIGYFSEIDHPSEGRIRSMAVPSEWSDTQPEFRRHTPLLGEHTREVLREAGLSDTAIDAMLDSGAAKSV